MAQVDVALYNAANTGTALSTLANAFGAEWQDVPNDKGRFRFELPLGDPDVALCTFGRTVRFGLAGSARWAGVIDTVIPTPIDERREGIESMLVEGPGYADDFDTAKVRAKPVGKAPGTIADFVPAIDDHDFDWYGMHYDRSSGWSAATKLADHGETSAVWPGLPGGMRVLGADWIWSASPDPEEDERRYFYEWVYLGVGGYVLDFAAYDAACFINGKKQGRNAAFGEKARVEFSIRTAGYVLLCFEAEKRSAADPGLVWQITEGEDGPLVHASSTTMYVRPPSGDFMTAGEILRSLKADHPSLDDWSFDFTGSVDSDGNSLTGTSSVSARIGADSLWDVLQALAEVYIDFEVYVQTKTLRIYNKGTQASVSTLPVVHGRCAAAATEFVNVKGLEWERRRAPFNALIVRYEDGPFERPSPLPASPRFGYLGLPQIADGAKAIEFADALLDAVGVDQEVATLELVRNLPDDQLPYVAFNRWSVLEVPSWDDPDVTVQVPVKAITCRMDSDGQLNTIVELGSLAENAQTLLERWIARSTRGGLSGLSQAAQGVQQVSQNPVPPLNQTEFVIFDAVGQSSGAVAYRTMPGKGLVHKLSARVKDDSGGTSSVEVTIAGTPVTLSGTTAAGFQLLDIDEGLSIPYDPRTVAQLDLTTVGHDQITIYAAVSETRG